MNYTLDFSLTTDTARTEYISSICSSTTYTSKQYTQMADYILLASNKNNPQAPFIYPEEFSNPKREHSQESLDELLDDSLTENDYTILESTIQPIQPTIYKKTQRKIDRNNPILRDNPYMQQLWTEIDNIDSILSTTTNHKLSKLSISLHKQQYDLMESLMPQWPSYIPSPKKHSPYFNWQRGIQLIDGSYADLDLTDYTHMAKFLKLYPELVHYCTPEVSSHYITSELYTLLSDTQQAIRNAALSPLYLDVLYAYWTNWNGKQILSYINNKYGKKYNQPTLSTMFNTTIAKKISTEYAEIYWERLYRNVPEKWRVCNCCGKLKLLNSYNFHRASGKPKGFSLTCKACHNRKA